MSALESRARLAAVLPPANAIEARGVNFAFARDARPTLIGALRTTQSGSIRVLGRELAGLSGKGQRDIRRRIGFIFQDHNLFDALTTFDTLNLAMKLCAEVPTRGEIVQRAGALLASLGIADYLHAKPNAMSTGQKQRVAIARALIHSPRIILADEPTASLDRDATHSVLSLLRRRADEEGVTVLMVTHDTQLFDQVNRVIVMKEGRIAEDR